MKKTLLPTAFLLCGAVAPAVTPGEALDFLYGTLSLPDRADYSREFYEKNVESSLRARRELPWGDSVPDREFLHFVLPVRVNNESLDSARWVFYRELKPRVEGLSMRDAILEVNHWCHEKVTYKPSDGRTSSPLSAVSQAIGRCGEESTFTVAALRSVGIPARQIYTPRWAHTDDNHAWVEAWADGRWYFLGACEPEPVLNLAWFNDPASRGLLMNTNVAGVYKGEEEILSAEPLSTRINVTSNYAPVGTLPVQAVDMDGRPVPGAKINFCIYNYSEYYPAVTKTADSEGKASLTAGLGDMMVWATDGHKFGYAKARPGTGEEILTVILDMDDSFTGEFDITLTPPVSRTATPAVTPEQRDGNIRRLATEDSIRNAYQATFANPKEISAVAKRLGLDAGRLSSVLTDARGNHEALVKCMERMTPAERGLALALLENVSEKDRRDIPVAVIDDAVAHTLPYADTTGFYDRYVLSPRIEVEALRPWREPLQKHFVRNALKFRNNPSLLVKWASDSIAPADNENPLRLRMSPLAVLAERKADRTSRNIFFVAAARSIGIPARIDPVTGATQYSTDGRSWTDARFSEKTQTAAPKATRKGYVKVNYEPSGYNVDPVYYSQFSISRIEDGVARQLEFDEGATVSGLFAQPVSLDAGQYILTTGQRMADGSVLAHSKIFTVQPAKTTTVDLKIRNDESQLSVIGSLNAENIYHDLTTGQDKSLLSTTGRGYYILGLIKPGHEPSAHALNDITAVADRLEATGAKIMLLFDNADEAARFDRSLFGNLPATVVFGIDNDGQTRRDIESSLHLEAPQAPVFVIADTFNRIVWVSQGYTIGTGETLLRNMSSTTD